MDVSSAATSATQTCYRHPNRETGVSCSSCGRPICPDCMTPTPVGMRCPECARQRTKVRTAGSLQREPTLTYALIGLNVLVALATLVGGAGAAQGGGGSLIDAGAVSRFTVAAGEIWRLLTAGFLHAGLFHLFFNMFALYVLGGMLEPAIGRLRFALIYVVSLLAGSFGALLLQPTGQTVGASGAVFGIFGAVAVLEQQRVIAGAGALGIIFVNLIITFVIPGISIGGHLGGLAGGALGTLALSRFGRGHAAYGRLGVLGIVALVAVGVGSVALAYLQVQRYA